MNCSELQAAWDTYRDAPADLPAAQRAAIEEHLRRCAACAVLWDREGAWLDDLAAEASTPPAAAGSFRASVLAQWDQQRARSRSPILGRIGWLLWPPLAAAAAVALAVLIVPGLPPGRSGAISPGVRTHRVHLGAMVQAIEHSYFLRPGRVLGDLKKHGSELAANVSAEVSLDASGLPDPAEFFAPAPAAQSPTPRG
jgi:anti-sigma factor RsiW